MIKKEGEMKRIIPNAKLPFDKKFVSLRAD